MLGQPMQQSVDICFFFEPATRWLRLLWIRRARHTAEPPTLALPGVPIFLPLDTRTAGTSEPPPTIGQQTRAAREAKGYPARRHAKHLVAQPGGAEPWLAKVFGMLGWLRPPTAPLTASSRASTSSRRSVGR